MSEQKKSLPSQGSTGILYVVSTPIGNLEDMTFRAVRTLKEADLILAEDTRHSRHLMEHFEIRTPMQSYHDFNKEKVTPGLVEKLQNGENLALVSDAGTPGVADPAFYLVRECARQGIQVRAVPGASALLTALVASGFPTDRFCFEGFPPKKSAQRIRRFGEISEIGQTWCYYVSPHQLRKVLNELEQVFGPDHPVALMRELTKKFEEHLRGPVKMLQEHYKERNPKGEYVLLIHPQYKEFS